MIIFPEKNAVAVANPFIELEVRQNKRKQKLKNVSDDSSKVKSHLCNKLQPLLSFVFKRIFYFPIILFNCIS
jgi:hypothetical protein